MPTPYRITLILGLCFGWAVYARSQTPPDQTTRDWPRLLGENFDGQAATAPELQNSIDWTLPPTFKWSAKVGLGYGLGAVSRGRYFHFDADDSDRSNPAERTTARDLQTGELIWTVNEPLVYRDLFGYEEGSRSSPTIDGDQLFTLGVAGRLACRNTSDGKLNWSVDTIQKYGVVQNFFGVGSSPLVIDDAVIVMVGGSPAADQDVAPMRLDRVSPNGSALVAFDRNDGHELWRCGKDLASYSSPRTMKIDGKTYVLLFARGGLILVDPDSGSVQWRYDHRAEILESVNAIVPVVDGNEVFISECYQVGSVLLRVTAKSAEPIWIDPAGDRRRQAMRSHWATPVLADGFLYGCSGRNAPDSDLRCIDWKTGEVKWTDDRRTRSSTTRVGDHLIVLEERGEAQVIRTNSERLDVVATWPLNRSDGDRPALAYPCWSAPIVVDDLVIVRGDEHVVCLKLTASE
ncbi:MAG: PQQ-binding-like beta-propeller repeat protein [Rubripirellula sp.]